MDGKISSSFRRLSSSGFGLLWYLVHVGDRLLTGDQYQKALGSWGGQ